MKNKKWVKIVIFLLVLIIVLVGLLYGYNIKKQNERLEMERSNNEKIADIQSHYSNYVKTLSETDLYVFENGEYKKQGKIGKDIEISLSNLDIDITTEYFPIVEFNNVYFVRYDVVTPIDNLTEVDTRYKNYIPFNLNVETTDKTRFYKDEKLVYELEESVSLPIIIKDSNKIYVEYQDKLLYILEEESFKIVENVNTEQVIATEIATIAYHFIYNPEIESCNQIICHSINQVQSHIDYLKSEAYFTPTMIEFEMYIDGKLQLPKNSVVITVDDGWLGENARDIFTENKINATIFFITSGYNPENYVTDYIEVHSHGDNLHTQGICPGGQGGAIKCVSEDVLLEDLRLSREKTFNSTVFCYPFYEYNNYSIEILKKAGFTMAFGGSWAGGHAKTTVGSDKYQIPRFTLLNYSTVDDLANILNS